MAEYAIMMVSDELRNQNYEIKQTNKLLYEKVEEMQRNKVNCDRIYTEWSDRYEQLDRDYQKLLVKSQELLKENQRLKTMMEDAETKGYRR